MPNYRPVVQLLVDKAKALGYHPVTVRDEEELYPATGMSTSEIIDAATATDEASITFRDYRIPKDVFGARLTFYLVYGNQLNETICDYTDHGTAELIANNIEDHFYA